MHVLFRLGNGFLYVFRKSDLRFLWVVDTCPCARIVLLVSEVGRFASLASLGSLGAHFLCGAHSWLRPRLYLCVTDGAPREPRFARVARRPLP